MFVALHTRNLDYSALKVWIRLGITVGQLLASASAMLSGVETLGEGDDILKTLESILESNEASSRNFFSVFVEPEAGVDDDSTSLASAIAGLDPECGPDPKGLKLHTYGVHREEWEGFVKAAADFANS